ncbi:MAG TPA: amidohydrolase family protein [Pseudolabrys sp.]|jgi:D-galactarolactone isomerase|nr:amidohydrolase family protein [Pseudolabrys sp.]
MPTSDEIKPKLKAPAGTTDTHIHFYDHRFPVAKTAVVKPADALVPEYMKVRKLLGIERTVVVQASAYGTDNSCLLAKMDEIGPSARAVVIVDASVTDAELDRLTKLGARGVRFFMLPGAPLQWDQLEAVAARVAPFGWHVIFQMDGRDLAEREAMLRRFPAKVIIDHTGKFLEPVGVDHPGFRTLMRLVDTGNFWVKLAGPYETSKLGPPYYNDVGVLAKTLAKAAPERMVWASNWPYAGAKTRPDNDAQMIDFLLDWIPDEAARHKALVDNPAELYGF